MKKTYKKFGIIIMLVMLLFTTNSSVLQNFMLFAATTGPEVLESNRFLFTLPTVASEEWRAITVTEPCSSIDVTVTGTFDVPVSCGIYTAQDRTSTLLAERGIALHASNAITEETNIPVAIEEPGTYWLHFTNACNLNPYYYDEGVNTSGIICEYKVLKGDEYENNNTMENATPLLANTPHEFTLLGMGDRDWFKCTVYDLANPLSITVGCNEGNFDSYLAYTVYYLNEFTGELDRVGGVGDTNYASGGINSTSTKTYTLEDAGDYYIHVTNSSNLNSNYYWGDNDIPLYITSSFGYDESKIAVELAENEFLLKVYDKNGVINDLPVIINDESYTTDEKGMIIFEDEINDEEDVQEISVKIDSQDGKYSSYYMNPFYINKDTKVGFIKLKYANDSDYELMSALIGEYDILNGTKKSGFRNDVDTEIVVQPYSEVGIKKYAIMQGDENIVESLTRNISVPGGTLKVEEDVYAVLYDENDEILSKTLLNIKVIAINPDFVKKLSFGTKFSSEMSSQFFEKSTLKVDLSEDNIIKYEIKDDSVRIGVNVEVEGLTNKEVISGLKDFAEGPVKDSLNNVDKLKVSLTTETGMFAELKFCDGLLVSSGGVAVIKGTLKCNVEDEFTVYIYGAPVPLVASLEGKGELKFEPSIQTNVYTNQFEAESKLEAKATLEVALGLGCSEGSAGVYGEGSLKAVWKNMSAIELIEAEIEAGIYAKLGVMEWKGTLTPETKFQLYPDEAATVDTLSRLSTLSTEMYDLDNYNVISRDYLTNRSNFYTASTSSTYSNTLQSSAYPYIEPQLINCNGTMMMAYLDDNGGEDNTNFQQLVYSVYNGKWQQPITIDEDTNVENSFQLYTDNTDIYLVYTELNGTISESSTAEEIASMQEIVVAKYDSTQSKFVDMATLTNNATYDYTPKITVLNNVPVVAWLNNADNNMFGTTANNAIYYSKYENNTWTEPQALITGSSAISKMEMGVLNNEVSISYINDTDNNLSTHNDRTLNVINLNKEKTEILNDIGKDTYLQYANYNNKNVLVWKKDNIIQGISSVSDTIEDIYTSNTLLSASDIKFIKNYDGNDMITFVNKVENEEKTKLYGVKNIDNEWKTERVIYSKNENEYVDAYGITTYNNYLIAVVLDSNVNMETLEKNSVLQTMRIYNSSDAQITVKDITIDENTVNMNLVVDNISDDKQTIQSVEISDSENNVIHTQDIVTTAEIGETKKIPLTFTLDASISSENYTISCRMRPSSVTFDVVNEIEFNLKQVDFEVYSEQIVMNGKNYVSLTVENNGYYNSKAVLDIYKVNATEESMTDEKVKTIVTNSLEHGQSANYLLEVTDEFLPDGKTEGVIKVVANTVEGDQELAITDNTTSVAIAEFTEELPYRKGDINKDGLVDSADAAIALNLYKYNNATESDLELGDMDENGMIDSADAAMILNIFKYNL